MRCRAVGLRDPRDRSLRQRGEVGEVPCFSTVPARLRRKRIEVHQIRLKNSRKITLRRRRRANLLMVPNLFIFDPRREKRAPEPPICCSARATRGASCSSGRRCSDVKKRSRPGITKAHATGGVKGQAQARSAWCAPKACRELNRASVIRFAKVFYGR